MSDWKVIVPNGDVTNLITNPSFETATTGWATGGANTIAQSTDVSTRGAYALKCTYQNNTSLAYYAATLTAAAHSLSMYVWIPTAYDGTILRVRISNFTGATGTVETNADMTKRDQWQRVTTSATIDGGDLAGNLSIYEAGAAPTAGRYVYIDAAMCIIGDQDVTYIDGEQPGCEWNGAAHASTSALSGASRAGGLIKDLETDYSLYLEAVLGAGMTPRSVSRDGFGQLPGGALNNSVRASRTLTLVGLINSTTLLDFHDKRNALIDLFNPEAFPRTEEGWQPVLLRYTGGTTDKEISVHYEAGLEMDWNYTMPFTERIALRLFAPDPNWYEIGETSTALDTNDTATLRYVGGRLKSTGQWDDLGLTADPAANGTVYTICIASDKTVYIGGNFDGLNNDAPAGMDYVAKYTPSTDAWSVLVGASDVNGAVYIIKEGPDKKIYIGGAFTQVNGDAGGDADYIIVYDPAADAWEKLGVPNTGTAAISEVYTMAWDSSGNLYIGGNFDNFADVAAADGFAKWDGASWSALGAPAITGANYVYCTAIDSSDNIYIGGLFTNCGGDGNADYWAWYEQDAAAWAAIDDIALNGIVFAMTISETDELYVSGSFTDANSVINADKVFKWTGTAIEALDVGFDATAYSACIAEDGNIYFSGAFTTAGALSTIDRIAIWNGSTWILSDINLPGAVNSFEIIAGESSKVTSENYDIYVAFNTTGAAYFSGSATVTNNGTVPAYPKIIISRSGGTTARLVSIRNENSGKTLYCDYSFVDGETLTIDTAPDAQTVESTFFGSRFDAVLPGSDWAEFTLLPGDNQITCFVDVTGAPTITANLKVKSPFDGMDD